MTDVNQMVTFTYSSSGHSIEDIPQNTQQLIVNVSVGPPSPILELSANRFHTLKHLVQVDLREGLQVIGESSFQGCTSLRKLKVPTTVKRIGDYAMDDCRALREVELPDGLESLGEFAFGNCTSLVRIKIPSGVHIVRLQTFHYCKSLVEVLLEGVREIGWEAFFNCVSLTTVKFTAATLKIIDSGAFYQCSSLTNMDLPEGLKEIRSNAFVKCSSWKGILDIPSSVTTIGDSAFLQCTSLTQLNLPNGLTEIATSLFEECAALVEVKVPGSVKTIQDNAFRGCKSLMDIELKPGLLEIGKEAFARCFSLRAISLPCTLERIGKQTFQQCARMVSIEIPAKEELRIGFGAFSYCHDLRNIVVPCNGDASWFQSCAYKGYYADRAELLNRFQSTPVHRLCYYTSSTAIDELREALLNEHAVLDMYEMTPFHVLVSAAKPRVDLLKVLLNKFPPNVCGMRDLMGMQAVEYLVYNWKGNSSKKMMRLLLERWMIARLEIFGSAQWLVDVKNRLDDLLKEEHTNRREIQLKDLSCTFERYETLASVIYLELALWKRELAESQRRNDGTKRIAMDRGICRALCGASVVIPNVTNYL